MILKVDSPLLYNNVLMTQFTFYSQYVTLQCPVQITSLFIQSIVAIKKIFNKRYCYLDTYLDSSSKNEVIKLLHFTYHLL